MVPCGRAWGRITLGRFSACACVHIPSLLAVLGGVLGSSQALESGDSLPGEQGAVLESKVPPCGAGARLLVVAARGQFSQVMD